MTEEERIYEDSALLEWARSAPEHPGNYDTGWRLTEDQAAYYDYDLRKWHEKKPNVKSNYGDF